MYLLGSCIKLKNIIFLFVICLLCLVLYYKSLGPSVSSFPSSEVCDRYKRQSDFQGFDNITGDPYDCKIVPNYVHFVKFKQTMFNFPHTVCLLAALKNQNPERIYIHTDAPRFEGKYWDILQATPGFKEKLFIINTTMPTEIFGQPLNKGWMLLHGSDITRLRVLMQYGGLYLDNDVCIIRNMDYLRRFEMSIGWKPGTSLGNMIIMAHRNARFLYEWLESYNGNYHSGEFYYNAGDYPANNILKPRPYLVHREEKYFGNYGPFKPLYLERYPEWRNYYTIHTLSNHLGDLKGKSPNLTYPIRFSEKNIMKYPVAYRDLVLSVFPNELITKV